MKERLIKMMKRLHNNNLISISTYFLGDDEYPGLKQDPIYYWFVYSC